MKIPKKVRIGIRDYEVRHIDSIKGDDTKITNSLGYISPDYLYIEISKQYPKWVQIETLLHEICHGIMHEMKESKLAKDEKFVSLLSKQLYILLTENDFLK